MKRIGLVALILSACGGAAPTAKTTPGGLEPDVAVREARDLIEEAYGSLRRGDANGLMPLLAPEVFLVGPRAADVLPAGSDALVALTDALESTPKHKLKSRDLQVVASPGGHAAWATDQIELDGATYAMTAILTNADDLWTFRAVHLAQTWKPKALAKQTLGPGAPFPTPSTVDPGIAALAGEAIVDLEARLEQLPDVDDDVGFDAVVTSTKPKGATHGVKKIAKAWNKLLDKAEPKKKKKKKKKKKPPEPLPVIEVVGELAGGVTDDGTLAWVCANVTTDDAPGRMFLLYAKIDGDWRLMSIQDAAITG